MNTSNIIYIPMSGVGLFDDPKDDKWLKYRLDIFRRYTLKSILNQSALPSLLWLSFDGRENNPLINELYNELRTKLQVVITYDGLMYKDDKFIFRLKGDGRYESTYRYAKRMLGRSIKRGSPRLFFLFIKRLLFKNASLQKRMSKSLAIVSKRLPLADFICLTRMDSDDMLHKDFLWELQFYHPMNKFAVRRDCGYIYNSTTDELAEWFPKTAPQFMSVFITRQTFFHPKRYYEFWENYTTHEDVVTAFYHEMGLQFRYLMLIHGNQISSTWNHPFRRNIIEDKTILKDFGI